MSKWQGIDEFLAVAAASSFTRGAGVIGMSPTHVSRAIQTLEHRLQAQLFHRTTRTVRLTDAGRVFLDHCRRIAQETDEAIALIGERGEPQGELRVTCSTAMGERFIAPLIRRFAMQHPGLSVSIELTNRVVDLLVEGFDLAIRTGRAVDPSLIGMRVASRRLHTCAAPSYLARAGRPDSVSALAGHECIVGSSQTWHFQEHGESIEHKPAGRFRCNSGHAVMEACVAGLGICQLPDFYVTPWLRHGMVELLLEDARPEEQPIWAVYPQRRHLSPKIQLVIDDLRRELQTALNAAAI
ncbi:MAG: LysR substrate-binding domain-containing protein [Novosphingobium sp.]